MTNFEPSRYNLEAIACSDLPVNGRRMSSHKPAAAAPEALGEITFASSAPPIPQQQSGSDVPVPPYVLHSLLQLQASEPLHALPLSSYSFGEPSFYWPFGDVEQKVQLDSKVDVAGGILQLANSAV